MRTNGPSEAGKKQKAAGKNKLRLTIAGKLLIAYHLRDGHKLFFLGGKLFFTGALCLCVLPMLMEIAITLSTTCVNVIISN